MGGKNGNPIPESTLYGKAITAKDLREVLEGMDDDTLIAIQASGAWNWAFDCRKTARMSDGHPVLLLDEQTN